MRRHPAYVAPLVCCVIGLLWAVAGALTASPASAHAGLVSATPSSGSTVDGIPAGVVLAFSSPVQARLAEDNESVFFFGM